LIGRLKVLQAYTEPIQIWIATAATGMSHRLNTAVVGGFALVSVKLEKSITGLLQQIEWLSPRLVYTWLPPLYSKKCSVMYRRHSAGVVKLRRDRFQSDQLSGACCVCGLGGG